MADSETEWMTATEAANFIGFVQPRAFREWLLNGKIPGAERLPNQRWRIPRDSAIALRNNKGPLEPEARLVSVGVVRGLIAGFWLPEIGDIPSGLYRPGFHTVYVHGKSFSWESIDRRLARCWIAASDEELLLQAIGKHKVRDESLGNVYHSLQARVCKYVVEAARYNFHGEIGTGRPSLEQTRAAIISKSQLGESDPDIIGNKFLLDESQTMPGVVESFVRSAMLALT